MKELKTLRIRINNNRPIICGVENGVTTFIATIITSKKSKTKNSQSIQIGALDALNSKHLNWKSLSLKLGDKISITLQNSKSNELTPFDSESIIDNDNERFMKEKYVEKMALELGWKTVKKQYIAINKIITLRI